MSILSDHYTIETTSAVCIRVPDTLLDKIQERFVCAITDESPTELIIDVVRLREKEDRDALIEILGIPETVELPTKGYIVFWN